MPSYNAERNNNCAHESCGTVSREEFEQRLSELEDRVSELEQEVSEKDEYIGELEDRVDELEDDVEENTDEIDEIKDHAGKERATIWGRLSDLENTSEPTANQNEATIDFDELTGAEQLARGENQEEHLLESDQRAIEIFDNFMDWSRKTPTGYIINNERDNTLSLLKTARDEQLQWGQYDRAAENLEDLTNGAIEYKQTDRQGKFLVLHEDTDLYDRLTGSLTSSSVGTKGEA